MRRARHILLLLLMLSAPISLFGDEVTDSFRRDLTDAQRRHDVELETITWERLAVTFYNQLEYDSLIAVVPECMAFYHKNHDWEHYYYVWRLLVSAYIYSSKNNTALREVRKMYDDAQGRNNDYGIAMASHVMGLAYSNIYGDYCEVLSAQQDWKRLLPATEGWHRALRDWGHGRGMTDGAIDSTVFATYCFVAQAKAQRGLRNYDEAERMLKLATRNAKQYGDDSDDGYWHHVVGEWASYYYDRDMFDKALLCNDEMMYWAQQRGVDSELNGAEQQRAEILMELGRYKEASELWQKVQKDSETRNLNDAKNQLSEMNSLFQLDELEVEQQTARTRYILIIASLIVTALLLLLLFRYQSSRRLAQKNKELAVALDHAQESDRMKSSFISHISHEIRTPLNIVTGFTQVLNSPDYEVGDDERKEMLGKISENSVLITKIVNELLELSSSESSSFMELNDETTVENLCQQAVSASGIQPTESVDFILQNDEASDIMVRTDVASVTKILQNLLQNAMKFTQKGSITLKTSVVDDVLHFYVIDTGIGVPAEAQQRIFEKFEKVDSFREGIGLGLNLARTLARRIGGDVVLSHSDSSGSIFELLIPIHPKK